METIIRDVLLIAIGFISCGLISFWIDLNKDKEKRRWEQWYQNRNKR
jgi:hypothetical protein